MPVLPELHPMVTRIAQARQFPADPAQSVAERRAAIHRGGPALAAQVLEIPALDLTLAHAEREPDPSAAVLTRDELAANVERYCEPDRRAEPYASPLLAPDL